MRSTTSVCVSLPAEVLDTARQAAEKDSRSLSSYIAMAVRAMNTAKS